MSHDQSPPMQNSPTGPAAAAGGPSKSSGGVKTISPEIKAKKSDSDTRGWKNEPWPEDRPKPAEERADAETDGHDQRGWRSIFRRQSGPAHYEIGAWFISAVLHASVLILLGLWIHHAVSELVPVDMSVSTSNQQDLPLADLPGDAATLDVPKPGTPGSPSAKPGGDPSIVDPTATESTESPVGPIDLAPALGQPGMPSAPQRNALDGMLFAEHSGVPWGEPLAKLGGGGLGGRSKTRRTALAGSGGGSATSEAAVERGLKWLIAHQHEDGSWSFMFEGPPCEGLCRNPGVERSTTAATALALLPFYGAGYTHQEGPYKDQVSRGLYYLGSRMLITPNGGDLEEGTMYAQGISTIVLCEAYAMSHDENLRPYAQKAVDFIVYAQDRHGGGWRYTPGMPGDTTVTGWQLMALKSAQMAGLEVPSQSFFLANKFLDSVQDNKGATYGYLRPGDEPTTSAVGLLCRMYLGWGRQHPALLKGVAALDKLGPSMPPDKTATQANLYFDYYATQVLYHHHGPAWERWNKKMREFLVSTQSNEGHESGSWYFQDRHGDKGGRLYNTAIAILTLEVYYRYLPLYSNKAVDEGF
jgi:hypothetical protein